MRLTWAVLAFAMLFSPLARAQEARPEPPASMGVYADALGLVTGFLIGGVDYAVSDRVSVGLLLTNASVELADVEAKGVGWGVGADYFITGSAIGTGFVVGGNLLFLPTEFTDRSQSPALTGEIFGLGAILTVGYQWVFGPFSVRPALSLAYFDFPDTVYLTGGTTPQARDIDRIHGTVPAAHFQVGVVF